MASSVSCTLAFLMLVCLVFTPYAEEINCLKVYKDVAPCLGYLQSKVRNPPSECCGGVKNLNIAANTTPKRRAACACLKTLAKGVKDIDFTRAGDLPRQCGVTVPFKISLDTDCSSFITNDRSIRIELNPSTCQTSPTNSTDRLLRRAILNIESVEPRLFLLVGIVFHQGFLIFQTNHTED